MVTDVNELSSEARTSKKVPPVLNDGAPTGLLAYRPTVSAPTPLPVAVMDPLPVDDVATADPVDDVLVPWPQLFSAVLLGAVHDGATEPGAT